MAATDRKASAGLAVNDSAVSLFTMVLAIIGFVFLTAKVVSFVRLVFSLFILPALPVRTDSPPFFNSSVIYIIYLCSVLIPLLPVAQFRPTLVLGSHHRRF